MSAIVSTRTFKKSAGEQGNQDVLYGDILEYLACRDDGRAAECKSLRDEDKTRPTSGLLT